MPEELPRAAIGLVGISKRFDMHAAVDDVSLEIGGGRMMGLEPTTFCMASE